MSFDIEQLRLTVSKERIEWRKHTLIRLSERKILQKDVLLVLRTGEVIRFYSDDRPFPSVLLLGWVESRPLHVVASYAKTDDVVYIITVYEPSLDVFEPDRTGGPV